MWPRIEPSHIVTLSTPFPKPQELPQDCCVFFDVGSVLLDLNWDACWQALKTRAGVDFDLPGFLSQTAGITTQWCTGVTGPWAYAQAFIAAYLKAGGPLLDHLDVKHDTDLIVGPPRPRALALASRLRRMGFQLGILSNATPWHEVLIEQRLNLREHFDVVVYSQDVGFEKPDLNVYVESEKLAKKHRKNSKDLKRIFFVDDLPQNIVGARAAGWTASLVNLVNDTLWNGWAQGNMSPTEFSEKSQHTAHMVFGDAAAQRVEALFIEWFK